MAAPVPFDDASVVSARRPRWKSPRPWAALGGLGLAGVSAIGLVAISAMSEFLGDKARDVDTTGQLASLTTGAVDEYSARLQLALLVMVVVGAVVLASSLVRLPDRRSPEVVWFGAALVAAVPIAAWPMWTPFWAVTGGPILFAAVVHLLGRRQPAIARTVAGGRVLASGAASAAAPVASSAATHGKKLAKGAADRGVPLVRSAVGRARTAASRGEPAQPVLASAVAGWYADPLGSSSLRYWDGSAWTDEMSSRHD